MQITDDNFWNKSSPDSTSTFLSNFLCFRDFKKFWKKVLRIQALILKPKFATLLEWLITIDESLETKVIKTMLCHSPPHPPPQKKKFSVAMQAKVFIFLLNFQRYCGSQDNDTQHSNSKGLNPPTTDTGWKWWDWEWNSASLCHSNYSVTLFCLKN